MIIAPAILMGLLGSFHCIGMCGPIAISLPKAGHHELTIFGGRLLYNLGRIITYAIIGGIVGLIGKGIFLTGFQQIISIGLGVLLIAMVLLPHFFRVPILTSWPNKLRSRLIPLFKKRGLLFSFLIGLLNGLLPCGLVYMAIAGALATGDPLMGMVFMMGFGIGTAPIMLMAGYSNRWITPGLRVKIQKAIPVFVVAIGLVFILRGLNLGIPYLSPKIAANNPAEITACE